MEVGAIRDKPGINRTQSEVYLDLLEDYKNTLIAESVKPDCVWCSIAVRQAISGFNIVPVCDLNLV